MAQNDVWDLVEFLEGCKRVGCKWVFRLSVTLKVILNVTRPDLLPKILLRKMVLIIRKLFCLFLEKDSLRIIMALVAHYDLELHQMNVKIVFLNNDLEEDVYMGQPVGFTREGNEYMVYKLKRSIYGLKQPSRQ